MSQHVLDQTNTPSGIQTPDPSYAVWGDSKVGVSVIGTSARDVAIYGLSAVSYGVYGESYFNNPNEFRTVAGVRGVNTQPLGLGVMGNGGEGGIGVIGSLLGPIINDSFLQEAGVAGFGGKYGVLGQAFGGTGVGGISTDGTGVNGLSEGGPGVYGSSDTNYGVIGYNTGGGERRGVGVGAFNTYNSNAAYLASDCCAAWFSGGVHVAGDLSADVKHCKIDHPLHPDTKYLVHACVESSEMKNIYDGLSVLDSNGGAEVVLPAWFEALNTDFRYQLTAIGGPCPNLHIVEGISNNRFRIGGGTHGTRISWQVTGFRKDAWAAAHPLCVEQEKSAEECGYYLHPELYGAPEEKSIGLLRHPRPPSPVPLERSSVAGEGP